jgi:dTDP-4-dehydrorhamnose reductase
MRWARLNFLPEMTEINKKIILLGGNGMLGQMVERYFSRNGYAIHNIDLRYEPKRRAEFMDAVKDAGSGFIINCIGRIKQKTTEEIDLFWANAMLPLDLADAIQDNQFLIHPSTDCVFDGLTEKPYAVETMPNAQDAYGKSKRLGEVALIRHPRALVVRVSIIGPDRSAQPKGLLGWFLSNPPGTTLNGFTNHWWNGITTLEWCKQIEKMIESNVDGYEGKLFQLGTQAMWSKYEMLLLFQKVFFTEYKISQYCTEAGINRCLLPTLECPDLSIQLKELKSWMDN